MTVTEDLQSVLFVCSYNAVRSPIAEALMKKLCGTNLYVQSAGSKPGAASDPFAVCVMKEVGIDLIAHVPRSMDQIDDGVYDLIVALSSDSYEHILTLSKTESARIEYWPTSDATLVLGAREYKIASYRDVRNEIEAKIRTRFANWLQT